MDSKLKSFLVPVLLCISNVFLLILCCVSYVLNIKRLKENGSFIHPRWEVSTGSSPHPFTSESYELAWTTHDEFWENSRKLQVLSPTAVAPNPRAVGRHRSVGQLVLSRTESIHNLHCFCFVYFLIVNKYLFWKLLDSLHHIWLSWWMTMLPYIRCLPKGSVPAPQR